MAWSGDGARGLRAAKLLTRDGAGGPGHGTPVLPAAAGCSACTDRSSPGGSCAAAVLKGALPLLATLGAAAAAAGWKGSSCEGTCDIDTTRPPIRTGSPLPGGDGKRSLLCASPPHPLLLPLLLGCGAGGGMAAWSLRQGFALTCGRVREQQQRAAEATTSSQRCRLQLAHLGLD